MVCVSACSFPAPGLENVFPASLTAQNWPLSLPDTLAQAYLVETSFGFPMHFALCNGPAWGSFES